MKPVSNNISGTYIICGMWGTTHLQLSLVDTRTGRIAETRSGRGISKLQGRSPELELFSICQDWIDHFSIKDVMLGGMVGSSLGWWEVTYVACPVDLEMLTQNISTKTINGLKIHIVSGLKCQNFVDEPDIMRGEEVEAMAWLKSQTTKSGKRSLICIPGTHTKWVEIIEGQISRFQTSVVGECFDLLTRNGVLTTKPEHDGLCQDAFLGGVDAAINHPDALLQLLMSVRARSLLSGQSAMEGADRLSGLLIGTDIVTALKMIDFDVQAGICPVIGTKSLCERYVLALSCIGAKSVPFNAPDMGVKGLFMLFQDLKAIYNAQ